ncbi:hypothetical protein BDZ85DRAFT_273692 [Elsinoe ampelina]|uniref:Uncharacterized protein n=1 Tax=Elsinoe ampelina TaxID=302913 RepID=A0A6A6GCF8_9PEZI|nr:hypothetical protein BDZ85DRAFT_273692 [Elsinoe ampelina]
MPVVDLTEDDPTPPTKGKPAKRTKVEVAPSVAELDEGVISKKGKSRKPYEEKRLARFRDKAPQKYWDYYERANTQRMFALDRRRKNADDCPHGTLDCPSETVDLAGSTGNVYTINISHVPTCTCPDFQKGNKQCKHIIYVLVKVLKAPTKLSYQLAFLTSELREIFEHAGPLPIEQVSEEDKDGKRRSVEGDCPICCCDLDDKAEEVVWCKAACGNNLHKSCFDQWAASRRGQKVTCPYCRTAWTEGGDLKTLSKKGRVGNEGYVNIASELGLSGRRDYSSYHSYWVRRQARDGLLGDGDFFEDEGY